MPDLVLIDGGKGQLDAALKARDMQHCSNIPFIGLAKREEQIVVHRTLSSIVLNDEAIKALGGYKVENDKFVVINLPHQTNLIKLLQRCAMNHIVLP